MKNKIYPFLLGLSCIMIVALVSFKNSEKAVEKEQMVIIAHGAFGGSYVMNISSATNYETIRIERPKGDALNYIELMKKVEEFQKTGWVVTSSNATGNSVYETCYFLEREKKQ